MYTILFFILLCLSIIGFSIAYNRDDSGFTIGSIIFMSLFFLSLIHSILV